MRRQTRAVSQFKFWIVQLQMSRSNRFLKTAKADPFEKDFLMQLSVAYITIHYYLKSSNSSFLFSTFTGTSL